jgi:hypothetical protein
MKEEKQVPKKAPKAKDIPDKIANRKRIDFLVTYEVEGSRPKKQRAHAYSKEEAEEIVATKLKGQISSGEINSFKIISVEMENLPK